MLTKEDLTQIRYICTVLGATTKEEITDIVTKYTKTKRLNKINVTTVISTIINDNNAARRKELDV